MKDCEDAADDVGIFGYQSLLISVIVFSLIILLFVYFSIKIYNEYGYLDAIILFAICVSFFFGMALLTFFDRSDVIVNGNGVGRKLFGWTWRMIFWKDIQAIVVYQMPVLTAAKVRSFIKVIPIEYKSKRRRSIVIARDLDMEGAFITSMNLHIAKYKIPVQTLVSGSTTKSDHL